MEINILELFDWKTLLLCAIVTTFIVSAMNTMQTKLSSNWLVFIVSLIVTVLSTTFTAVQFADFQKIGLQLLMTMAFAILFYNYLGKLFIDKLFIWIKKQIDNKLGKDEPTG